MWKRLKKHSNQSLIHHFLSSSHYTFMRPPFSESTCMYQLSELTISEDGRSKSEIQYLAQKKKLPCAFNISIFKGSSSIRKTENTDSELHNYKKVS